jgi:hypothetical protein
MTTRTELAARYRIDLPPDDETVEDLEVPIHAGPQRQGDVAFFTRPPFTAAELAQMTDVPPDGVTLVRGEATGNTHILHAAPAGTVRWAPKDLAGDTLIAVVHIQPGGVGYVIHTDEHSMLGYGPNAYEVRGKRTQREEIERVQD